MNEHRKEFGHGSRYKVIFLLPIVAWGLSALPVRAQAPRATIAGTVTDESGAVMPGVTITIINTSTGVKTTTPTDGSGHYYVPYLQPGVVYRVVSERQGFATVEVTNVQTVVNQTTTINMVMKPGKVQTEVTVKAAPPVLETHSGTLGGVIGGERVRDLPLLGRNPYSLVTLIPGARPSAGLNDLPVDQIGTAFASINGSRGNQNEYLLDGAPNSAPAQNQPVIYASVDTVQEFKVETNNYSAEFGRAAGGVFNVVTKSGGSQFHGDVYEFFRNDKLDASNFFANRGGLKKPEFRFNQFGATLGGPVILPHIYNGRQQKTFFFVSYEGARVRQGVTYVGTVPTLLQREGDFSQTFNSQGKLIKIFNPLTTRPDPNRPGMSIRDPFPGNKILTNLLDPVALNLLKLIPPPNALGDPVTGVNNFVSGAAQKVTKDTYSVRLDHTVSNRQNIFGRFSYDRTPQIRSDAYGNVASPSFGPQIFNRRNLVIDDVYTFSPTLILNWHYSFARLSNFRKQRSFGFDPAQLGFPRDQALQIGRFIPALLVSGMGGSFSVANQGTGALLGGSSLIGFGMDTHAWQGSLTKAVGRHTVKVGGEFRLIRFNAIQQGDTATNFSFGAAFTQGPDPTVASGTAGFGFASSLLGVGGGQVQIVPALALQQTYSALFIQEDFRATPKLTLNLGLRYEYESPRTDRFNRLTNFDFNATPPLKAPGLNLRGGLTFVGVGGNPRGQWSPDRNNFAPRLGFAYRLTSRTVVRGGSGMFYAPTTGVGGDAGAFGVSGFLANTAFVGSLDGITPFRFLQDPYPDGIVQPTGSSLGLATLLGQAVQFTDRHKPPPYTEEWNLNIQRELPGDTLLEVGYAGSHGLKLIASQEFDQLPDSALSLGNTLQKLVPNPFFGQILTGPLSAPKVSQAQLLRPFPQFTGATAVNSNWASSIYHALQAKLDKRMGHGINFTVAYTFSKLIDTNSGGFAGEALGGTGVQDNTNLRAERSISTLDAPRRLAASYIWELPAGPGKRFLAQGPASKLLGGWVVNGIIVFQSGVPLGVSCATNTTFSQGGGCRPNLRHNPRLPSDQRSVDRWFDTGAFAQPAPFTFGNSPRTIPSLRGDATKEFDFSVFKRMPLTERFNLEFRAEFFNLFNHPRFDPPSLAFGPAKFGTISSQGNLPRDIQLALKLYF